MEIAHGRRFPGMSIALAGFLTALGLIAAIGSQNAYVLRQGLLRHHVGLVVGVCIIGDVLLELAGVLGMGAIVQAHPTVLTALKWFGAAYLVWFGLNSLRSAFTAGSLNPADAPPAGRRTTALTVAGLTWLNPHVYLDTVVLIGSLANTHGSDGRWLFYAGSVLGSVTWFVGLGYGARLLSPLVRKPRTWQVIDTVVAVMMFTFAVLLVAR